MNEPISVEADLSVAPPRPRSFQWQAKRHVVADVGRRWTAADGRQHYLVRTTANEVFEIAYAAERGQWRLVRPPGHFGGPPARV